MLGGGRGVLSEGSPGPRGGAGAGTHANVLGPEEELTAEVGALDVVHVCDSHAPAAPGPQAHQGEAFEQLAADSTCAHLPAGAALARGPGSLALPQTLPVSPHSSPGGSADGSASPENQPQTLRFAHRSGSISRRQTHRSAMAAVLCCASLSH